MRNCFFSFVLTGCRQRCEREDTQPLGAVSHLGVLYLFPGAVITKYHKLVA